MRQKLGAVAIPALRWSVGIVVLLQSLHFAHSPAAAHHWAQTGWPLWIRPALAWSEAAAALLFLVPVLTLIGGSALLLIFAVAIGIHFHVGDFGVGALIVYGMAVVVCIVHREKKLAPVSHE